MLSFSSIGALLLAVAIPVAVGFIGTAVGGGGDSGNCDRACKINCHIFVTNLFIWHKVIQVDYDDLDLSLPSSPEFLTIQTFKMEGSGLKPRTELIDLCFLFDDRLVQTAEQALMDSSGMSLGSNAFLFVLWHVYDLQCKLVSYVYVVVFEAFVLVQVLL